MRIASHLQAISVTADEPSTRKQVRSWDRHRCQEDYLPVGGRKRIRSIVSWRGTCCSRAATLFGTWRSLPLAKKSASCDQAEKTFLSLCAPFVRTHFRSVTHARFQRRDCHTNGTGNQSAQGSERARCGQTLSVSVSAGSQQFRGAVPRMTSENSVPCSWPVPQVQLANNCPESRREMVSDPLFGSR